MYSQPIRVVPKPHSNDLRIVIDQSARPHTLNSWMDKADASIHLDNLQDFRAILCLVRKCLGSNPLMLFKDDVSKADRRMPAHPLWHIKQIVTVGGQRHVDRCLVIGGRTSGCIWCTFMALVIWIAIYVRGIEDMLHYSDDAWSYDPSRTLQ